MEKFFVALLLTLASAGYGAQEEVKREVLEKDTLWPPDIVPHPHPPGSPEEPKKPEVV